MLTLRQVLTRLLIFAALPQFLFDGCSFAGLVIGGSHSYDDRTTIPVLGSGAVEQGTHLTVHRKDFTKIRGEFLGLRTTDEESFSEAYTAAAADIRKTGVLPLPGDSLLFVYSVTGGKIAVRGRFRGLGPVDLFLFPTKYRTDDESRFILDSLGALHVEGKGDVNLASLRSLASGKYLLSVPTHLILKIAADTTVSLPVAEIRSVEVEREHYGWLIGFGIGAVVDIAVLTGFRSTLSDLLNPFKK